ncbi:MAG: efflux RND transporter periplasmic adaptor subunit [Verrucomicrobiales bacterium]|nr:MAG: efflux RND transporter periplasmic adaptor subunit [Verrucomicrobiaceae bacterium]
MSSNSNNRPNFTSEAKASADRDKLPVDDKKNRSSPPKEDIVMQSLRFIVIPVIILGLGYLIYSQIKEPTAKPKKPPGIRKVPKTKVIELHVENYTSSIESNGIINAHNEVNLTSQVPGRVVEIHPQFEDGAFFKKGTILVELEEADFLTSVASAEAMLAQASASHAQEKARSEQARLNWEDLGYDEEPNELVLRLPQLREAEARVNSATTQLAQAKRNFDRSKIKAPFDGRVRKRLVGVSQAISGSTPLGNIFAVDYAEVRIPISAKEMRHLNLPENPDDPSVEITLHDALDEKNQTIWPAQIIRTEGTLDENSLELFAIAKILDPFGRNSTLPPLRIGQPVNAKIPGKILEGVIKIPRRAVRQLRRINIIDKDDLPLLMNQFLATVSRFPLKMHGISVEPIRENQSHIIIQDDSIKGGTLLSTTPMPWIPDGSKVEIIFEETPKEADDAEDRKTTLISP